MGSLLVYTLILFDVKYSIENLDDTIFYIRTSVCILGLAGSIIGIFSRLWMIAVKGLGWTPYLIIHIYYQFGISSKMATMLSFRGGIAGKR